MPTLTNTQGQLIDMLTGEVVGQAEGAPAPMQGDPRATGLDLPAPEGKTAQGLINNFSWGFNSALFALPDFVAKKIGQGLGMQEDQVATLAKFFNKGERTPVNAAERYSRAVGEGVGGTLPFTGILAFAAKASPMVKVAEPGAGVLKSIANSAIQYAQKSPMAAAATDIAFGAGYEGLRQAVEENMDEANPYKDLYKDLLPAAAFMGLPLAAASLPSVKAAGWTMDKIKGAQGGLGNVEKEAIAGLPKGYRLPIVNIIPNVLVKRAESKLAQVFGPINESPEAQAALKQLEAALSDPRIAEAGFMFDVSERTMYSPLLSRKAELLEKLGPKELESVKARINENQQKLATLFDSFSPEARKPIEEAFMAAQQERQNFFEGLLRQKKDMTDAEVAALSERLGPQNLDMLNNELRGVIMADMEADFGMRQKILSKLGMKRAVNPDGTLTDTRFRDGPDAGKTLPQYPAYDIEEAARALVAKYTPARATGAKGGPMPEPIKMLQNMVAATDKARQEALKQATESLINQRVNEQLAGYPLDEALREQTVANVRALISPSGTKGKKAADELARQMTIQKSAGITGKGGTKRGSGRGHRYSWPSHLRQSRANQAGCRVDCPRRHEHRHQRPRSTGLAGCRTALAPRCSQLVQQLTDGGPRNADFGRPTETGSRQRWVQRHRRPGPRIGAQGQQRVRRHENGFGRLQRWLREAPAAAPDLPKVRWPRVPAAQRRPDAHGVQDSREPASVERHSGQQPCLRRPVHQRRNRLAALQRCCGPGRLG